jgi:hypothetical protein
MRVILFDFVDYTQHFPALLRDGSRRITDRHTTESKNDPGCDGILTLLELGHESQESE